MSDVLERTAVVQFSIYLCLLTSLEANYKASTNKETDETNI
jgi:hypothetical protein